MKKRIVVLLTVVALMMVMMAMTIHQPLVPQDNRARGMAAEASAVVLKVGGTGYPAFRGAPENAGAGGCGDGGQGVGGDGGGGCGHGVDERFEH